MRFVRLALASLLLLPAAAAAEQQQKLRNISACARRNIPEPDSIRAMRVIARDRLGAKRVTVVRLYGRWTKAGRRQQLAEFIEPAELRGSKLLILEGTDQSEIYFRSAELGRVKRISGGGRASALFESDFSYEDYEYLEGLRSSGKSKRVEDAVIGTRPVYVLETRPAEASNSAYELIVAFVDQKTCVPLRIEFYETGRRLRKELTVDPAEILQRGPAWIPHSVLLRDIRDYTTTLILVDRSEQKALPPEMFSVEAFQHQTDPVGAPRE